VVGTAAQVPAPGEVPVEDPVDEVVPNPEVGKPGWTPAYRSEPVVSGRDWMFADVPVTLRLPTDAFKADVKADVAVLEREMSDQVSPVGAAVALEFLAGPDRKPVESVWEIVVDYADVALIFGGDFLYRLQLVPRLETLVGSLAGV